jgi:cytosine deaminase
MTAPARVLNARLPRWLLPPEWPHNGDEPALATLTLRQGRIAAAEPVTRAQTAA